ncbi:DUF1854 domain-containing protein [Gorillibacterium sp. sgz500922]|uniref:DUF1854 domain-containing protein n=1 Tax=Gorillibacterium sp. sgz500922 TaxID=3446694 RepID=UPI003F67A448
MTAAEQELTRNREIREKSELTDAAQIVYLTPENAEFKETTGQMLAATVGGEVHPVVFLHCSFPHTNKRLYISIRTIENKEIGIIKSLDDFPNEIVRLLEKHIQLRYFAPEITKVSTIKEEYGYSYWDTQTTAGACRFTVQSGGSNVKMVSSQALLITDVDGNRFIIPHIDQLSDKEYRMVEMCM